jgi:hypothetical protein
MVLPYDLEQRLSVVALSNRVPNGAAHVHLAIGGVWRGYFMVGKRAANGDRNKRWLVCAHVLRVALLTGDAQVDAELTDAFHGMPRCSTRMQSTVDKTQAIVQEQQGWAPCADGGRWPQ